MIGAHGGPNNLDAIDEMIDGSDPAGSDSEVDVEVKMSDDARMKEGWSIPDPAECQECVGSGDMKPGAHHTGDGWWLHWYCDECGCPVEDSEIPWPFENNAPASAQTLRILGFTVVP